MLACFPAVSLAHTSILRFADTHPVSDMDSLEQWVSENHKAPPQLRLTNLIALERTYVWLNKNKIGTHLTEISQLANQLKVPAGQAAVSYVKAELYLYQKRYGNFAAEANKAIRQFGALRDTSGLIHAHSVLVAIDARIFGGNYLKEHYTLEDEQLAIAESLLRPGDVHDWLMFTYWRARSSYTRLPTSQLSRMIDQGIATIANKEPYQYAMVGLLKQKAVVYAISNQHQKSYAINTRLIQGLRDSQVNERSGLYYNLAINCDELNRLDEGLMALRQCITAGKRCSPLNHEMLTAAYKLTRALLMRQGKYRQAAIIADSQHVQMEAFVSKELETRAIEMEGLYALKRRQAENELLKQKQHVIQAENRLYNWELIIAAGILGLVIFLALWLHRAYRRLSEVLAEREQTSAKLSQALTEVRELNKARDYFIGIIAHDMRRPLISYRGLGYLISELLKQGAYDRIESVSIGIDKLGMELEIMLDNLLKWALEQRQSLPYHPQLLMLNKLINKVLAVFNQLIDYEGVAIVVDCPDDLQVWADEQAVELILRNLFENALRFTSSGGQIQLCARAVDSNQVEVRIKDNGFGIEPDKLAYLQAVLSGSTKGEPGQRGLGLGLVLVRDFVKLNHGHVQLDSVVGQGTCYSVLLPMP